MLLFDGSIVGKISTTCHRRCLVKFLGFCWGCHPIQGLSHWIGFIIVKDDYSDGSWEGFLFLSMKPPLVSQGY